MFPKQTKTRQTQDVTLTVPKNLVVWGSRFMVLFEIGDPDIQPVPAILKLILGFFSWGKGALALPSKFETIP